jgi:putative iron-regulated protein
MGIRNVYLGRYRRVDGRVVSGPSLSDLVKARDAKLDGEMKSKLDATMAAMTAIVKAAVDGEAYDQMIANGNAAGNARVQAAIDALTIQTRSIEKLVATLGLSSVKFEGSDSLDSPQKIFQ